MRFDTLSHEFLLSNVSSCRSCSHHAPLTDQRDTKIDLCLYNLYLLYNCIKLLRFLFKPAVTERVLQNLSCPSRSSGPVMLARHPRGYTGSYQRFPLYCLPTAFCLHLLLLSHYNKLNVHLLHRHCLTKRTQSF